MKIIVLITFLVSIFSLPSWSETLTMDDLVERNDLYYEKFSDVPFTGEISGIEIGSFKNGKKNGEWLSYHRNGQLFSKGNFTNGEKGGLWEFYHENGQLKAKDNFKNGKLDGESFYYWDNGQLSGKGIYKNNKGEGTWVGYHVNGQLSFRNNYNKSGELDGATVMYTDNGQLMYKGTYKNGERDGYWENFWSINGQLKTRGYYKNGKKEGYWEHFNKDGIVMDYVTGTYQNGELIIATVNQFEVISDGPSVSEEKMVGLYITDESNKVPTKYNTVKKDPFGKNEEYSGTFVNCYYELLLINQMSNIKVAFDYTYTTVIGLRIIHDGGQEKIIQGNIGLSAGDHAKILNPSDRYMIEFITMSPYEFDSERSAKEFIDMESCKIKRVETIEQYGISGDIMFSTGSDWVPFRNYLRTGKYFRPGTYYD